MKNIWQVFRRELKTYFVSPRGYLVLTAFLVLNGLVFYLIVEAFSQQGAPVGSIMQIFLARNIFHWIFFFLFISVITMGLLAEERRSGTVELLLTAPVTEGQVVTGKYLAAYAFYLFLWVPTLLYPLLLARHASLDPWPIAAGYLYLMCVGAPFIAVGLWTSALSRSQIASAILAFALMFLLFILPVFFETQARADWLRNLLSYANLWNPAGDYGKGIVDSRLIVYTVSGTLFLLLASARTLELRKAR
jgi:ABC-2 type transport system permease protein